MVETMSEWFSKRKKAPVKLPGADWTGVTSPSSSQQNNVSQSTPSTPSSTNARRFVLPANSQKYTPSTPPVKLINTPSKPSKYSPLNSPSKFSSQQSTHEITIDQSHVLVEDDVQDVEDEDSESSSRPSSIIHNPLPKPEDDIDSFPEEQNFPQVATPNLMFQNHQIAEMETEELSEEQFENTSPGNGNTRAWDTSASSLFRTPISLKRTHHDPIVDDNTPNNNNTQTTTPGRWLESLSIDKKKDTQHINDEFKFSKRKKLKRGGYVEKFQRILQKQFVVSRNPNHMNIDPNTMHVGTLVLHVVQCKMEGPILTSFCHVLAEQPQHLGTRFIEVYFSNEHLKQQQANIMPWSLLKISSWHLLHCGQTKLILCSVHSTIEFIDPAKNMGFKINQSEIENMLFEKQQQMYRTFTLRKTNNPLPNNNNNNMICDDDKDQNDTDDSPPAVRRNSTPFVTLPQIKPYQEVVSLRAQVHQVIQPILSARPSTDAQAAQFMSPDAVWERSTDAIPTIAYRSHLLTRLQQNRVCSRPGAIIIGQLANDNNSESASFVGEISSTNSELCSQVKEGTEMDFASLHVAQRMNIGTEYVKSASSMQPYTAWLQFTPVSQTEL